MTTRAAIVTASVMSVVAVGAIVLNNTSATAPVVVPAAPIPTVSAEWARYVEARKAETRAINGWTPVPEAAAACPTARPLPPYAPTPAAAYCTEKRFYAMNCGSSPGQWMRKWQTEPGFTYQGCGAHTWIVADPDGHDYPIVDQGPNGFRYGKPPNVGPAQESWHQCWDLHNPPAGGYDCSRTGTGIAIYQDKTLAQVPQPPHDNWAIIYGCCAQPTATAIPVTPVPGTPTPAPISNVTCIPITAIPR